MFSRILVTLSDGALALLNESLCTEFGTNSVQFLKIKEYNYSESCQVNSTDQYTDYIYQFSRLTIYTWWYTRVGNDAEPRCTTFGSSFDISRKSTLVGKEKIIHGDGCQSHRGIWSDTCLGHTRLQETSKSLLMWPIEKIDDRLSFTGGSVWKPEDRACEPLRLPSPA